ncbi:hypothetical protein LTR74_015853 [Friedmanniomyces endolithicus]|nr:hypothetical protein LTR74_015853 [Friedmanniomyces endolithicus]
MSHLESAANQHGHISDAAAKLKLTWQRSARVLKRTEDRDTTTISPPNKLQALGPLFRLPRELRDTIWSYTFHTTPHTKRAHFHIYDTVIDSCTHDAKIDTYLRRHGTRTALLRTCRAVNEDAVQTLYDNTHFELVVLAGVPRPYQVRDSYGGAKKLSERNVLGSIGDCARLLMRIRHATVLIHPGRKPDAKRYEKRLALGGGAHLRSLGILVASSRRGRKDITPEGIKAFNLIATAFEKHVIAEPKTPRHATLLFEFRSNYVPSEFQPGYDKLREIVDKSSAPEPEYIRLWKLESRAGIKCITHEEFGEMQAFSWMPPPTPPSMPPSRAVLVADILASPISIPVYLVARLAELVLVVPVKEAVRRRRKGQRLVPW